LEQEVLQLKNERIGAIVMLGVGIVLYVLIDFQTRPVVLTNANSSFEVTSRSFPRIAIGAIILFCIIELIAQFMIARRTKTKQAQSTETALAASVTQGDETEGSATLETEENLAIEAGDALTDVAKLGNSAEKTKKSDYLGLLGIAAGVIFYLLMYRPLGYLITGIIVCTWLCLIFKAKPLYAVMTGFALPILIYLMFAVALRTPLPKGLLPFL